jgi:hypothetical protein
MYLVVGGQPQSDWLLNDFEYLLINEAIWCMGVVKVRFFPAWLPNGVGGGKVWSPCDRGPRSCCGPRHAWWSVVSKMTSIVRKP